MIAKLRRKFILILMGIISLILLAVFLSLFLSTWNNNRNMREEILREALRIELPGRDMGTMGREGRPFHATPTPGARVPILVAQVDENGHITFLTNQLHFLQEDEADDMVRAALDAPATGGILGEKSLYFLKSEDGSRVALTDASAGQEMLHKLMLNALIIGGAALSLFFLISLWLSGWAVRPVELAWQKQQRFVADASHELKTPLTVILSNAELLSGDKGFLDEKRAKRMEHIQVEAQHMKKLVEELLSLARSDNQEGQRIFSQVDFSFLVTNSILTMEPLIYDERKSMTYEVGEGLSLMGDALGLRELVGILLDNARKYCPVGGKIHVRLGRNEKKGILLTVFNEGKIIPKEELEQIFLRFYRLDQARNSRDSYGLGLAIAQGIVKNHGGKIWAESVAGQGNTFYVSLPQK